MAAFVGSDGMADALIPSAVPEYVPSLVLRYLVPPSASQIPAHLLSSDMVKRHELLGLTPTDPEYYARPLLPALSPFHADQPERVIAALNSLDPNSLDDARLPPVRYVASSTSVVQALCRVPAPGHGDIILVFSYEHDAEEPAWKLFDTRLFVAASALAEHGFATVEEALADAHATAHGSTSSVQSAGAAADAADAAYWAAYARSHSPSQLSDVEPEVSITNDEDSYWSRYSSAGDPGDTGRDQTTRSNSNISAEPDVPARKPLFPPPPPPRSRSRSRSPANLGLDGHEDIIEGSRTMSLNSPSETLSPLPSTSSLHTAGPSAHRTSPRTSYQFPTTSPRLKTSPRIATSIPLQMPLSPRSSLASVASLASQASINSPRLPPAPSGSSALDLAPSPTFAHIQHLIFSGVYAPTTASGELGLAVNLGTPPPTIPTIHAPLPNSPSMSFHPTLINVNFDVGGKGKSASRPSSSISPSRTTSSEECALAINLHPASASGSPSSAHPTTSMASSSTATSMSGSATPVIPPPAPNASNVVGASTSAPSSSAPAALSSIRQQSLGMNSPVSPPSRTNSYGPAPFTPLSAVSGVSAFSNGSGVYPGQFFGGAASGGGPGSLTRRGSHPLANSHTAGSHSNTSSVSSNASSTTTNNAAVPSSNSTTPPPTSHGLSMNNGVDQGVVEAVRGLYRMWKASRLQDQDGGQEEDSEAVFESLVRTALQADRT